MPSSLRARGRTRASRASEPPRRTSRRMATSRSRPRSRPQRRGRNIVKPAKKDPHAAIGAQEQPGGAGAHLLYDGRCIAMTAVGMLQKIVDRGRALRPSFGLCGRECAGHAKDEALGRLAPRRDVGAATSVRKDASLRRGAGGRRR
ncbi:hypothetical protein L1887_60341 [Cichorium endivia]|nr:hypothetical protein L1887_60341 [Cichorium endivia]